MGPVTSGGTTEPVMILMNHDTCQIFVLIFIITLFTLSAVITRYVLIPQDGRRVTLLDPVVRGIVLV